MSLKLALIIASLVICLVIAALIFAIWGLPKLEKWLRERYSDDYTKIAVHIKAGGKWHWEYGDIAWETPDAVTYYMKNMRSASGEGPYEVTMPDKEGFDYNDYGVRIARMDAGNCIAYGPEGEPTKMPEQAFNSHLEVKVKTKVATSISNGKGIDTKLVAIIAIALVAIVGVVMGVLAMSGKFSKPQNIIINTYNATANMTQNQTTPVITGEVVK